MITVKKLVVQDETAWAKAATDWLYQKQTQYEARSLYIPAGETPKPIYKLWRNEIPDVLSKLKLIQIDDVWSGSKKGIFKSFLETELSPFSKNIEFIQSATNQADLAILGLGLNGHIAFHEPGLPKDFYGGLVSLAEQTKKTLGLEADTIGNTYGIGAFIQCKSMLLALRGEKKKDILSKTLSRVDNNPASFLMDHKDLTILCDFEF